MSGDLRGKPVRVLVNAVSARSGGALSRLRALLPELDLIDDLALTIVATEPLSRELSVLCPASTVVAEPLRPLAMRLCWEQIVLRRRAKAFDVLYMPGNFGMAFPPIPVVVGVQSLWHWGRDGRRERARCRLGLRLRLTVESVLARFTVKRSAAIACVSQTISDAVTEDLGIRVPRVVTPAAPPDLPGADRIDHGGAIAIGTDLPHKDWDGLVAAFARDDALPRLLLVGPVSDERRVALERAGRGRVELLGLVTDRSKLAGLIRGSVCVVAHSRLESFGFVPLEGVVSNVPVAMSDIPAHREVCGNAGHAYPNDDPRALARAVATAIAAGPASENPPALDGSWAHSAGRLRDLFEGLVQR